MTSLEQQVKTRSQYWATSQVFDEGTRAEVQKLIEQNQNTDLTDRFYKDLEFGTGGLRGILGAGTSRMNIFNIRKATSALAEYLISQASPSNQVKVGVSYDSRMYSREFAEAVCGVLAAYNIASVITKELRPVPMLSFLVRHYGCNAGICITASHNPPEYNGYKVYWSNGGQLVPPHDKEIIRRYNNIAEYESIKWVSFDEARKRGLVKEVLEELDNAYFGHLKKLVLYPQIDRSKVRIVYSPLHGTGLYPVKRGLQEFGFNDIHIVEEQAEPNGKFPTVKAPNPEEESAMEMAVNLGRKVNADIVMATDPDSDRLGLYVQENGDLKRFNGNQIGSLLADFVLGGLKSKGQLADNSLVVSTVVTSDLVNRIASSFGVACEETLTGFKWICDLVHRYESGQLVPKKDFVYGCEESFGFLAGNFVRDKDAVIASCLASEMVAFYKSKGISISKALDNLFLKHGAFEERLKSITLPGKEGQERVASIMNSLRKNPPTEVAGQQVVSISDFLSSRKIYTDSPNPSEFEEITLPSSNVLQFQLEDMSKISVRPSGTEPKIKFYVSVTRSCNASNLSHVKEQVKNLALKLEEHFTSLSQQT